MKKKVAFVIAQKDFRDEELLEPKKVLETRGFITKVVSKTRNSATGRLGTVIEPDLAIPEVTAKDFAGVVFVGGPGAAKYFDDQDALNLAREFKKSGKLVGSICIAASILANAGVLISRTATGLPTEELNMKNKGADYTGMPVEVDGNIITAKDPSAAKEFGQALAYYLEG